MSADSRKRVSAFAVHRLDEFILAVVHVDDETAKIPRHIRRPFQRVPDFGVESVNYDLSELFVREEEPK